MDLVHLATILAVTLAFLSVYGQYDETETDEPGPQESDTWNQSHVHFDTDKLSRWALASVVVCIVLFVFLLLLLSAALYAMCVKKSCVWLYPREEE